MQAPGVAASEVSRQTLRLLVILPALDEERTIAAVVEGVPRSIPGVASVEVVVVDDGSRDDTLQRARDAGAQVIHHEVTRGVGAAFRSGLSYGIESGADLIVSIDADGQFDPVEIPRLVEPIVAGRADFVAGSRFADPALTPQMSRMRRWGNRMMSRLISRLAGQRFHDVSCGMRAYSRSAALQLHLLGRFTYTQEVFLNLAFKQQRIVEVPIRVRGEREFGKSRVAGNLWRYALRSAQIIFRWYRDYEPLRFFGGIALGLTLPAVLLAGFLLAHYLETGALTPHKWAGFSAAVLLVLALLVLQVGIVGDMLARHRVYLEEVLYRLRNNRH